MVSRPLEKHAQRKRGEFDMTMHAEIERALEAVHDPKVQDMIRALSEYGLGVFLPHLHTDKGFEPLPIDVVQLESDLKVEFVDRADHALQGATPVGWVWDAERAVVATACMCTGVDHDPHHWSNRTVADFEQRTAAAAPA
jgi:hypothetical protein